MDESTPLPPVTPPAPARKPRVYVDIVLRFGHRMKNASGNWTTYGPGRVRVLEERAEILFQLDVQEAANPTDKVTTQREESEKLVKVTLQLKHSVNGEEYGPGTVRVPAEMARMFLNTEGMAIEKEISLVQKQAFIVKFRNGHPVKQQVPYDRFDEILGRTDIPIGDMGG